MSRAHRGARAQNAHTDDWLITYADMITLLLCFFVILFFVLSSRKIGQNGGPEVVAPAQVQASSNPAPNARHAVKSDDFDRLDHPVDRLADEVAASIGAPLRTPAAIAMQPVGPASPAKTGAAPNDTPDAPPAGDHITTLEMSSSAFFGSGSGTLSEGGKSILRGVAVDLKSDQYQEYQIMVEGHTDDSPIATPRFSSNWELSTARAAAVVHFLLDQGISAQRLRAMGYADTEPKVPNRDAAGNAIPGNQAQNRRVVIRLEKIEKRD